MIVAGAGPGNLDYLSLEVYKRIKSAEKVLAFGRIAKDIKLIREDLIVLERVKDVLSYKDEDVLLLASGDPNFYGIVSYLVKEGVEVEEVIPGISSFQYLMAKLKKDWQDARFLSSHGRSLDIEEISLNRLSISLIDNPSSPHVISKSLYKKGCRGKIYLGLNLSYEDELILSYEIGDNIMEYGSLGVVVVELLD